MHAAAILYVLRCLFALYMTFSCFCLRLVNVSSLACKHLGITLCMNANSAYANINSQAYKIQS